MKRSSLPSRLLGVLMAAGALVLLAMWTAPSYGVLAVALFCSLYFLGLLSGSLPQGDPADVAAALIVIALFLTSPMIAFALMVLSVLSATLSVAAGCSPLALLLRVVRQCSALAASSALVLTLPSGSDDPLAQLATVLAAAVLFVLTDLMLLQLEHALRRRRSFLPLFLSGFRLQGWLLGAQVSVAALGVMIYPGMGVWSLPIVVLLLVVMRQSFLMLLDVRGAYRSVVESLVRALEVHDAARRGHSERVANGVLHLAAALGAHGKRLERYMYAALLHDVELINVESPSVAKPAAGAEGRTSAADGSGVLRNLHFLEDVAPILQLLQEPSRAEQYDESVVTGAYLISVVNDLDSVRSGIPSSGHPAQVLSESVDPGVVRRVQRLMKDSDAAWLFSPDMADELAQVP